jgi:tRNA-2-methylthio-N6-dimethylallyladenosine synthase
MKRLNTFFIRTYGCQMNELDSEILITQLEQRNLTKVKTEDEADLILLNTCSIRDSSERKILGKLDEYKNKKNKIIGICGCMSMSKKEALLKKFPHLNFIIGTNNLLDINKILDDILSKKIQLKKIDQNYEKKLDFFLAKRITKVKTFISIIRGCNNFCSYCVVPHTRGKEVSRIPESIIRETKYLANEGFKEITLLGQNVNSYGKDQPQWKMLFPDLLYELNKINGIERIRFMTSHPKDITKDLMYAIKDLNKVCEFVHFPIQSASNKILKKMNRKYTKESYLEKISLLKEIVPNVTIGTDIIVGFPFETQKDFEETYNLFKKIQYDTAFIFAYSPREHTLASKFNNSVPEKIKHTRLVKLLTLHHEIIKNKFQKLIGSTKEVLIEDFNKDPTYLKGRSRQFEKVIFKADKSLIGSTQNIQIKDTNHQTLIGEII